VMGFDYFDDGDYAALKTLGAVASAVSDPGCLASILAATETARAERQSADEALAAAKAERAAADIKLAELTEREAAFGTWSGAEERRIREMAASTEQHRLNLEAARAVHAEAVEAHARDVAAHERAKAAMRRAVAA
jgi:hypothetical protein